MTQDADLNRASRHRKTVILAEDDAKLAEELTKVLEDAGWEVRTTRDAATTLHAIESSGGDFLADAVVLDLLLPGGESLHFARTVQSRWPGLPIMALATRCPSPSNEEATAAGINTVISTVLDFDALAALLAFAVTARWRARLGNDPAIHSVQHTPRLELRGPLVGERRKESRFPLETPIPSRIRVPGEDRPRDSEIRDVSSRGLCARHVGSALPLGASVTLEYKPPGAFLGSVSLSFVVRWTQRVDSRNDAGLEFTDPDSKPARALVYSVLVGD